MPPAFLRWVRFGAAVGCLLVFAGLYSVAIWSTWMAHKTPPVFSEPFLHFATGMAGMVGGVAAVGLHVKLPQAASSLQSAKMRFQSVGRVVLASQPDQRQLILGGTYVIVYMVLGATAMFTWAFVSNVTPDVVKNLATISFGLLIAVGTAYFS